MRRSINYAIAAAAATLGSLAIAGRATAQATAQASTQKDSAPAGWVGLSVIQNAHGEGDSNVKLAYPVVASVDAGSPARTAGLVAGDTILAYNDVDARSDPLAVKRFLDPGRQLTVKIRRNGIRNLTLTVAKRNSSNRYSQKLTMHTDESAFMPLAFGSAAGPIAIAAPVAEGHAAPFAGAYLARLNAGLANALSVAPTGVLVVDITNGTAAMRSGLRPGDVITRADSITVDSPLGIMTAMRLAASHSVTLDVTRQGKSQKLTVTW